MSGARGIAFLGAGFISYLHLLALRARGLGRPVVLASQTRRSAEHRARIFGCEAATFDAIHAVVARPDVDVVFVLSPNALHAAHALAAIDAGKSVVVEKPIAVTLAEAESIAAAAERRGVGVGYAENQVFAPVIVRARERLASGAVGRIRRVVASCGHAGPPAGSWFFDPRWSGGGAQLDLGAHTVETALFLAGHPAIEAVERSAIEPHPSGVDGRTRARLSGGGIDFDLTSSFVEKEESMAYDVIGDEGSLRVEFAPAPFAQRLAWTGSDGSTRDLDFPHRGEGLRIDRYVASMGYTDQASHFLEAFASGGRPRSGARDGVRVLRILAAIYLAARTGGPVPLAEVPPRATPHELWRGAARGTTA